MPDRDSLSDRLACGEAAAGGPCERRKGHEGHHATIAARHLDEIRGLKRLLWECHCAASDGIPVPFERWLLDDGLEGMPADVRELREAYDTVSEQQHEDMLRFRTAAQMNTPESVAVFVLDITGRRLGLSGAIDEEGRTDA